MLSKKERSMKNQWPPSKQTFWYLAHQKSKQCLENIHVDVAIIGAGVAGLSAAQAFVHRGKKVAVFEQHFCGSGSTGKSTGFITPNAELSLSDFKYQQDNKAAQNIWNF